MGGGAFAVSTMLVLVLLGIILTIIWILLPFAVFGMKPLLRQVLAEQKETNRLLRAIGEDARAAQPRELTR